MSSLLTSLVEDKIAMITDTHFGVRKGSELMHNYFKKFYEETFFPTIDHHDVRCVVHLGDCFDVRKSIDYYSLDWAKSNFFDKLKERDIHLIMIVGNHDMFYKQSLELNSPRLNLKEYDNITIIDRPLTYTGVFMVPWICDENREQTFEELKNTNARWCMGHLELAGFYANKDYKCEHGDNPDQFHKFERVFSGHFHKKSTQDNVTYLGNPYQMYWNDEGDERGFHLFHTGTGELEFIPNPTPLFHKIYCKPGVDINPHDYRDCFIKLVIEEGFAPLDTSNLVDALYDAGCHDVKVIENLNIETEDDVDVDAEDTLTTLTNYVNGMDDQLNKNSIMDIFKSLYIEAQEV